MAETTEQHEAVAAAPPDAEPGLGVLAEGVRRQRRRRAVAARQLLSLALEGQLDEARLWDWDTLGAVPEWVLLDPEARERVRLTAGLLLLGPAVRLWIDRERLGAIRELVGDRLLEAVLAWVESRLRQADGARASGDEHGWAPVAVRSSLTPAAAVADDVRAAGTSVLLASVSPSLPLGDLTELLGQPAADLPARIAERLLDDAQALLAVLDAAVQEAA